MFSFSVKVQIAPRPWRKATFMMGTIPPYGQRGFKGKTGNGRILMQQLQP
jgi:hypothetical protein